MRSDNERGNSPPPPLEKTRAGVHRKIALWLTTLLTCALLTAFIGVSASHAPAPGKAAPLATRDERESAVAAAAATAPAPAQSRPLPVAAPAQPGGEIFFSAERDGRWEIYAARPGAAWSQITRGYSPARAPAVSPDGKYLTFQSRKDGNWEIYVLALDTFKVTRLTNLLAYDGAPSWSPDGKRIAFESYRSGDLDIWVMNADGTSPLNLTPSTPAYDFGPAWAPQGNWIAYTSWATGHKQIFMVSPDGKQKVNLAPSAFHDEQPAWSPDGRRLAFVSNREACAPAPQPIGLSQCQRREIFVAEVDDTRFSNVRQLTFAGFDYAPVWSPDARFIAFVSPRPERQPLYIAPIEGDPSVPPRALNDGALWISSAAWRAAEPATPDPPLAHEAPLYAESPIAAPASEGHPYATRAMKEIYLAPSWGQLSSRVANSFLALRARVKAESAFDFLSELADLTRQLNARCDNTCDNLSWHKSGRAVDTRLEYYDANGRSIIELAREDQGGETYWRVFLRAAVQDGSLGEPLKDAPWDFSARARVNIAWGQGGFEKPQQYGYYVDFTELARVYGWERISSHDDPDFNWRTNKLAIEYWHHQKSAGLRWYEAMRELYAPADLEYNFDWNKLARDWEIKEMRMYLKKIPPPPSAWKWYALIPN